MYMYDLSQCAKEKYSSIPFPIEMYVCHNLIKLSPYMFMYIQIIVLCTINSKQSKHHSCQNINIYIIYSTAMASRI